MHFLKIISRILYGHGTMQEGGDSDRLRQAINDSLGAVSEAAPDTSAQWMRLDRAIAANESMAIRPVRRVLPRVAFAAALMIAVVAGLYMFRVHPSFEQFQTGRGEQLHVLLPDSSEVTLSHTTALKFDRADFLHSRSISLSGEAYFKVRKTGTPFVVSTDIATIAVVGTEFNLRVRKDAYEVGVTEGMVSVSAVGAEIQTPILLHKGQLLAGIRGASPGLPQPLEVIGFPGWKHGKLFVERMTVAAVSQEIQDRFNVRIEVRESQLLSGTLSGVIVGNDANSMITTLSRLLGRSYRIADSTYILY